MPHHRQNLSATESEPAITREQYAQMIQQALAPYNAVPHPRLDHANAIPEPHRQRVEEECRLLYIREFLRGYGCPGDDA